MPTDPTVRTTRRAVVATGGKLAFTAPLVAATIKLSAGGADGSGNVLRRCAA